MNMEDFKKDYPDIYNAAFKEGQTSGHANGLTAGKAVGIETGKAEAQDAARQEGAADERQRIVDVEAQSLPGHEKLINTLKLDGKTTGALAAVQVLQAEKAIRTDVAVQLDQDAIDPVDHVAMQPAAVADGASTLPDGPDKWKAEYEKNGDLQNEFKSIENYTAFKKGVADGRVKIFGVKEVK